MRLFRRKRIKRPIDGHAEVLEAWHPNRDGAAGNCKMRLRLDVPGLPPLEVDHHEKVLTANRWPEEGMRVAVTVDADHPDRVDAHWDSVFGAMPGGALGYVVEELGRAGGVELDLSRGPEEARRQPEVPKNQIPARVDELNAQFARGEITYEEMAARLQRLLGG